MLKRLMLSLMLAAGLMLLAPASEADARHRHGGSSWSWSSWWSNWWSSWSWGGDWNKDSDGGRTGVPELDPNTAGSGLVLLIGGVAYIASRRRKEEDAA